MGRGPLEEAVGSVWLHLLLQAGGEGQGGKQEHL